MLVATVEAGSLGERAGLRPGDRLFAWRRSAAPPANPLPAAGVFTSPFDVQEVLAEEAPRGALTLAGARGGEAREWTLMAGASRERSGLGALPSLDPEPSRLAAAALDAEALRLAGESSFARGDAASGLYCLSERARLLARDRDYRQADEAFAQAIAGLRLAGRRWAAADLYGAWGRSFDERGAWPAAQRSFQAGLELLAKDDARPLTAALLLHGMAEAFRHPDDYARALPAHQRALALRRRFSPGSLELAESLFGVARTLSEAGGGGSSPEPEALLRQADGVWSAIDPGSLAHARLLNYLSLLIWDQGRIAEAERGFEEAYRWASRWGPASYETARILLNWGISLDRRGEMVRAERTLTLSLGIWTVLPPTRANLWNLATAWSTIAYLKAIQGDLETAEADARRALEIQERLQADSSGVADALQVLGFVETQLRRFPQGRADLRRAVALRERLTPDQLRTAICLQLLGALEIAAGEDLAEAERLLRRADAILEREGAGSLSRAEGLASLAEAVFRQDRRSEAFAFARGALAVRQRLAPGGVPEAESLHQLGRFEQRAEPERAAEDLCAAARIIDRLGERLAGAQRARTSFAVAYGEYYFDCLQARVGQGRSAAAFAVLEAGRARALLDLFSARELDLGELPEGLRRERETLYQEYRSVSRRLEEAGLAGDAGAIEEARHDLLENQRRCDELASRLRAEVPRFAALRAPRPLDLAGARRALDRGTVLLSYAVGAERSYLFVVAAEGAPGPGVRVFPLSLGGSALRRAIEELRLLLSDPASDPRALRGRGAELYRRLLLPAERAFAAARRLLLVPDGPLRTLPFAVLVRPNGRYLMQWKPLHQVVSATVYAELRGRRLERKRAGDLRLGGVGAPDLAPSAESGPGPTLASRGGALLPDSALAALPGARAELAAIGALFAPHAQLFVGAAATEERVEALGPTVDVLHLATHATLDEGAPLNSALRLSRPEAGDPGRDDGRLEVWEIIERFRLAADLVTLSACDSGLGREMGGEGLMGLTRAFQFAGARSVLATLWAVADESTAQLMPRFYFHRLAGRSKDDALRRAQMEALADPRRSHPSLWAAFVLSGDYR